MHYAAEIVQNSLLNIYIPKKKEIEKLGSKIWKNPVFLEVKNNVEKLLRPNKKTAISIRKKWSNQVPNAILLTNVKFEINNPVIFSSQVYNYLVSK